ncbi:Cytochrome bd-I ubiquinol oxidase subunit 2 [Marinomonas gallaica]|uniref:Cytochrome bd-I ubiquinol oxidase subunit 2 n=1 Tax=Marinomonas gallaica TaxID=1806667 RepID=A0A1C3JVV7_9GAMM|nr:cytochrome d ubiquinol oxidase subunit II [Marinomonas gallaica]SBT19277.1 Cytochrome bd-I ubiquinol oxidase subunit 2 [Marinomonas gallaica]SBT20967.1 Cytochrome bd-I ubiquinol oxidase subunit 2 [Marinomonas gallaica]
MGLDLVTAWTLVIGFGLMMYVLLDGFDLGIGLLFIAVRNKQDRDVMVNSVAPVWDGNETWLVLGGAGLMAAFPLAYSVILEALYIPLLLMLFGLIIRGVAFEFRFKAIAKHQGIWDNLFCVGSVAATFFQGVAMGAVIEGFAVENQQYVGGAWDWLSWFSILTGFCLLPAYGLLGSTWLLIKTENELNKKMRRYSHHLLVWLGYAMAALLVITPFLTEALRERWLTLPNFFYMGFIPMLGLMQYTWLYYVIRFSEWEKWPFAITLGLLALAYFTLITSLWPNIIPPDISIYQAAAPESSLRFTLWGVVIIVPIILAYTFWSYHVFRGKVRDTEGYH